MSRYDGNAIFAGLEAKIKTNCELTDLDMLNLVFVPLMNHSMSRKELVTKSIILAQGILDTKKRDACIAAAFAFANKYLSEQESQELMEMLRMTDLGTMLVMDEKRETAKKALKKGATIDFVVEITDLDESTVKQLKEELESA